MSYIVLVCSETVSESQWVVSLAMGCTLASWRYEFLVVGPACSFWALCLLIFFPNSLSTSRWFSRDDRMLLVARVAKNQTGIENRKIKWDHVIDFLTDIKSYMSLILNLQTSRAAGYLISLHLSSKVSDLTPSALRCWPFLRVRWSRPGLEPMLYSMADSPAIRELVCMLFMPPTVCACLGFLLAPHDAYVGRLICFYITGSYQTSFVLALSLITSKVGGQTKKQLTSAIIWMGACLGNIAGPSFFRSDQASTYPLGIGAMLVANCIELGIFVAFRFVFIWENKKRDRAAAQLGEQEIPSANETAFADLTDRQNLNFLYFY